MICPECLSKETTQSSLGNWFCAKPWCGAMIPVDIGYKPEEKEVTMELSKNHKWALFYREKLQWSVIPINPKGKKPLIKWKKYSKELPTVEEINKWWTENPDANIGLCTGAVSGVSVVDIDEYKTPGTLDHMQEIYLKIRHDHHYRPWDDCYSSRTARGGYHWFFNFHPALISRQAIPAVDIKSTGGYVIIPPSSINGTGGYKWIRAPYDKSGVRHTVDCPEMWVDIFCENPTRDFGEGVISPESSVTEASKTSDIIGLNDKRQNSVIESVTERHKTSLSVTASQFANRIINFKEGSRDESLFHIANCLFRGGMAKDNVARVLDHIGRMVCHPPFADAGAKFASALARQEERERPLREEIEEWIVQQIGTFTNNELDQELNIRDKAEKKHRRQILYTLRKAGLIEMANGKAGTYRRVLDDMEEIDYRNVVIDDRYSDFVWPMQLESLYKLMPKNIVVISGGPDSGKTAFMLGVTEMNMAQFPINYFSSEMGNMEFKSRLQMFPNRSIKEWKFNAFERDANFSDVIRPDEVNIIDFLEMYDNFYQIGGHIKDIFNKLDKGVAIIAIQKNPGVENPLGGNRAREKARMVVNLDRVKYNKETWGNELKITKCKNWAQPHMNPVGLIHNFTLTNGCIFTPQGNWRRES